MADVTNVTVGKPGKLNGQIYRAPVGTPLPKTADEALNEAFEALGYVSDAGVVNSNTASTSQIKAWGGDIVLDAQTEKPDTFKFTLIEALNPKTLRAVYGNNNVEGEIATGITIHANSQEQRECAWVIDMITRNDSIKRIVIGLGKVTNVGDVTYADESLVGYETTVSCYANEAQGGDTHQEFIYRPAAPVTPKTSFTVQFNTDGGTSVAAQTVEEGGRATEPASPTKDGFAFAGWYADDQLQTPFDFANAVTADITLYAKWLITYTVTFDTDGGTEIQPQTVITGYSAQQPSDPAKDGYTFAGWYTDDQFTQVYDFDTVVTENKTIYAKWEV